MREECSVFSWKKREIFPLFSSKPKREIGIARRGSITVECDLIGRLGRSGDRHGPTRQSPPSTRSPPRRRNRRAIRPGSATCRRRSGCAMPSRDRAGSAPAVTHGGSPWRGGASRAGHVWRAARGCARSRGARTRPERQLRMTWSGGRAAIAMAASSTPSARSAFSPLGLRLSPAPISPSSGDRSWTVASMPRR